MTRKEAIQWLKHCAKSDCVDCAYGIKSMEWCSEKMAYCVSVLEEALSEPSIVRCKDCRYFKKIAERSDSGLCHRDLVASAWKENGYCSRGERKGGDSE